MLPADVPKAADRTCEEQTEAAPHAGAEEPVRSDHKFPAHKGVHGPAGLGAPIPELPCALCDKHDLLYLLQRVLRPAGAQQLDIGTLWDDPGVDIVTFEVEAVDDILGDDSHTDGIALIDLQGRRLIRILARLHLNSSFLGRSGWPDEERTRYPATYNEEQPRAKPDRTR